MTASTPARLAAAAFCALLLLTFAQVTTASAAQARPHRSTKAHRQPPTQPRTTALHSHREGRAVDSAVDIWGTEEGSDGDTSSGGTGQVVDANYQAHRTTDLCPDGWQNVRTEPPFTLDPLEVQCQAAADLCRQAHKPDGIGVITWTGLPGVAHPEEDEWAPGSYRCIDPADSPTPVLTQTELRRLPLPPATPHVEPSNRPILVNVPTNVYADAPTITLHTTILGQSLDVQATPTTFTWTFGDGHHLTTTDPGAPYPDMPTTHTYTTTGNLHITLTTTYTARFRPTGTTPWIPAQGTANVTSPPIPIQVIETRAVLVP